MESAVVGYIVLFVVAVAGALLVGKNMAPKPAPQPKPEPKRFGVDEAKAAMRLINTQDQMRPILGVVVGVLGYENTVAEEVQYRVEGLDLNISDNVTRIDRNEAAIKDSQNSIRLLQAANGEAQAIKNELKNLAAVCATA
ncbi:MAG: hypothetical protein Q8R12_00460 [bacterium]|nr:hypothetical protein [bacterium]